MPPQQSTCPFTHHKTPTGGEPLIAVDGRRVPLYDERFAGDPHAAYRSMRAMFGPLVPVWLAPNVPATLVIGYHTAVRILHDDRNFPADPTRWEQTAARDSPVYPVLAKRRNALRSAGREHARYRVTITAALADVDRWKVERAVDRIAEDLINGFCETGAADLRGDYAFPLAVRVMCDLLGLEPVEAHQTWAEMAAMLDGVAEAGQRFAAGLHSVAHRKRARPGNDMMSLLILHEERLDDTEVAEQTALLLGPGTEPTCNLITNTILLMLTDERFAGGLLGGSLSTRDAIEEVLTADTPLSNFCISYPRHPQPVGDIWLPADQPVVVSMAACNSDPAVNTGTADGIDRWGNRSHLSWGAGAHACPARDIAGIIIERAIDQLLDALPDLRLTRQPVWRPGAFHRALVALPADFPACPPMRLAMPPLAPKEIR